MTKLASQPYVSDKPNIKQPWWPDHFRSVYTIFTSQPIGRTGPSEKHVKARIQPVHTGVARNLVIETQRVLIVIRNVGKNYGLPQVIDTNAGLGSLMACNTRVPRNDCTTVVI